MEIPVSQDKILHNFSPVFWENTENGRKSGEMVLYFFTGNL